MVFLNFIMILLKKEKENIIFRFVYISLIIVINVKKGGFKKIWLNISCNIRNGCEIELVALR